jgi:hypothetical protein
MITRLPSSIQRWFSTFLATFTALVMMFVAGFTAHSAPAPTQVFYIPFPENEQLAAFQAINAVAVEPLAVFVTFSVASDNTVIYYDHWEDGYESDITNPIQSTTLIYGDGNPSNGFPPGNPGDLLTSGSLFDLRNFVQTTNLANLDFDARDKVASFKPIAFTKTTFPTGTNTLLAGCIEVFEQGIWGTEYRVPVGQNMPTTTPSGGLTNDFDIFSYTAVSIMAGNGTYQVRLDSSTLPNGMVQTYDRDGLGSANLTEVVLPEATVLTDVDFGYDASTSTTVSGRVYIDTNGNGQQDIGENGLANQNVIVTDALGGVQVVVTEANGDWSASVVPGNASVKVDESDPQYPTGYTQTEGSDPSNVLAVNGQNTNAGTDGYYLPATLTGKLYIDTNGNGTQDLSEPNLPNVDVLITDVLGNTQTVTTNSNGVWSATVPPGSTTANIVESDPDYPTGYTQTEGTDPTTTVAVAGTTTNSGTDGFFLGGSISGITQVDKDYNDVGDLTLNNVTYRLLNDSDNTPVDDPNQPGVQDYVIVSTNGAYQFINLPPGQYTVQQDQPAGFLSQRDWDSTTDAPGSTVDPENTSRTDNRIPVDLAAGESDSGNDFVEYRCATLFDSWQLVSPNAGGTGDNPDGDIYTNTLEYAFCLPPEHGARAAYCIVPGINGELDLVFHRVAGGPQDLTYFLRYTNNLSTPAASWTEVELSTLGANLVITPDPSGLSEQVRITNIKSLMPNGATHGFYNFAIKMDYNNDDVFDVIDYTYVEGWQVVDVQANECETYSTPFLPCPQFTGVVTSMTGLTRMARH